MRRWTIACACLLIALLPLQIVALAVRQVQAPAHYHLPVWTASSAQAAVAPDRDDVVLERLDAATSARARHVSGVAIDEHTHAPGASGVVYVDDDAGTGKGASFAKLTVDAVTMQLPDWPRVLPARMREAGIATLAAAAPIWRTSPPERPPARPSRFLRSLR